jgi:hypothetical protein
VLEFGGPGHIASARRPKARDTLLLRLSRSRLAPLLSAALFAWLGFLVLIPLRYNELHVFEGTVRMQALFAVAVVAYVAHMAWHRRLPGPTGVDWALLAVVGAYGIAIALSIYPRFTLEGGLLLGLTVFTFYMFSDLDEVSPPAMVAGLAAVGVAGAVVSLIDIGEQVGDRLSLIEAVTGSAGLRDIVPPDVPRVEGVGDHVNMLALALNLSLPFAVLLALEGRRVMRWLAAGGAVAIVLALFFTVSRGAWIATAAAVPLFALLYARR